MLPVSLSLTKTNKMGRFILLIKQSLLIIGADRSLSLVDPVKNDRRSLKKQLQSLGLTSP